MACLKEAPSDLSSRSGSEMGEVMRLRLAFGGVWKQQADSKFQYVGGETYYEKLSSGVKYADLMHTVNEKTNGAAIFKYTPPGEEPGPNNLVTVIDDDHLQEMIEDYQMAVSTAESPGRRFRLLVWLSQASEEEVIVNEFGISRSGSWASMTQSSEKSDGTNSPMIKAYPHTPEPDDVHMQMQIAQEECLYIHDMEMAELERLEEEEEAMRQDQASLSPWDHKNDHEHADDEIPCLKLGDTGYRPLLYDNRYANDPVFQKALRAFNQAKTSTPEPSTPMQLTFSPPDLTEESKTNTNKSRKTMNVHGGVSDSVEPRTPPTGTHNAGHARALTEVQPPLPHSKEKAAADNPYNLPSSLGLCHSSFGLPSKLGSDLGNTACGTLSTAQGGLPALGEEHSPASTFRAASMPPPEVQNPALESPLATPELKHSHSDGAPMDHFHVVPIKDIRPLFRLGEGTFGEVLQCSNSLFGQIAVKCAKTEGDRHLFAQEVRMLSSLNHPNVLRFFGVVTRDLPDSEIIGVMTEFMQGRSLSSYLKPEFRRSSLVQRAKLARGAVNGLSYLHKHNIVHFDLKPENLLLDFPLEARSDFTPSIKVADFGLSKYKVDKYASTDSGLRGTMPYMAPEIIVDREHVTEKADIWSLGMVFWEMFTHQVPFGNMPQAEIVGRLRLGNAYPFIPDDMEQEWVELIDACCRPSPDDRFSLENIAAMLDEIIQTEHAPGPDSIVY